MTQGMDVALAFCIASAIGCIDEPSIYGSLRLLEVMYRLLDLSAKDETGTKKEAIEKLSSYIVENKGVCMEDETKFREVLNKCAFCFMDIQRMG